MVDAFNDGEVDGCRRPLNVEGCCWSGFISLTDHDTITI